MTEKTRYSDAELEEFRTLILQKLEQANADYEMYRKALNNVGDVSFTSFPSTLFNAFLYIS